MSLNDASRNDLSSKSILPSRANVWGYARRGLALLREEPCGQVCLNRLESGGMSALREVWNRFRPRLIGSLVWAGARLVGKTLRYRVEGLQAYDDVAREGGAVLITWHGRTFVPANYFAKRGWWAIISLSRDGDIQNCVFRGFGFNTIRGSTGRGGVRAALEAAKRVREGGYLALTPDGPRGPKGSFNEGALLIAQKSGRPVIPVGISARPRKLLPTWDDYLIPLPFARAALVVGQAVTVPTELTPEEGEALARTLSAEIDRLERRAEELVSR
jgi:lysophospholipid acyltransferase (LPLAT)-like uncharacterized protein